ncbi:MAG: hypothetical protein JXK94_04685 [Deltaproteobacteria bacterium]|nr:hypothetical protein [Deltaproteobacteria bacterium]
MHCLRCGEKAEGKFCPRCGSPLTVVAGRGIKSCDWHEEVRYGELMKIFEVRDLIRRHAGLSKGGMSAGAFLCLCDRALVSQAAAVPEKVNGVARSILERLGLKTEIIQSRHYPFPPGKTLVALLCSMARHGQKVRRVSQGEDGCVLEASLPSGLWSFEGDLFVSLHREGEGTSVEAATLINGYSLTKGKRRRCLKELLEDLEITSVA